MATLESSSNQEATLLTGMMIEINESKISKTKSKIKLPGRTHDKPMDCVTQPIVFNPKYDINFMGLENIHPFDAQKWGKIFTLLTESIKSSCGNASFWSPAGPISDQELQLVHTKDYLKNMASSKTFIARAAEVGILLFIPMNMIQHRLVTPMRWHTAGTVLAAKLALDHGHCINLGGGFHHCSSKSAGGFCLFADITLAYKYLWKYVDPSLNILILDLDAHQGNGHERDVLELSGQEGRRVYIMDMFNGSIYPGDELAKTAINRSIVLPCGTQDSKYLSLLQFHLNESLNEFEPNLIIYNAGTDILVGDPLGRMHVTEAGVIERDEIVFSQAKTRNIPIVMLTSGGYQLNNARVIAESIMNLMAKDLVRCYTTGDHST